MTGAIIAGIGQTEFSKESGRSTMRLAAEASLAAIRDAGMTPADIDGMVTYTVDDNDELILARTLGIEEVHYWARTPGSGFGASATVQLAASAVVSGAANAVLIYRAANGRSGRRFGQPRARPSTSIPLDLHFTYGLDTPAKMYSLWFQRYMHEYGVTNEDFGQYVVVARRHASTNPAAWYYERPLTLDEHQQSRWIVEPVLRLLDCCQESDGGVAIVVTSADRAGDVERPVVVRAAVDAHVGGSSLMHNYYLPDFAGFPDAKQCATRLWDQSGLRPSDIQVAQIYENFSPLVLLVLEAYGFCGRGEAAAFIAGGAIDLEGDLPVNTHGGLIGEAYIHGMNTVLEGVRQIRGTAANQVADVEHSLVSSLSSGLILGRP